jgi:L-lactate permease
MEILIRLVVAVVVAWVIVWLLGPALPAIIVGLIALVAFLLILFGDVGWVRGRRGY